MRRASLITCLFITALFLMLINTRGVLYAQASFRAVALKTEHLERALGIDAVSPRFSWRMEDARPGARQTAYCIVVDTDSVAVAGGRG